MNTDLQLIGNFGGELTVTLTGIRAKTEYKYMYSSRLKVKIEMQAGKDEGGETHEIKKFMRTQVCPQPTSQGILPFKIIMCRKDLVKEQSLCSCWSPKVRVIVVDLEPVITPLPLRRQEAGGGAGGAGCSYAAR